MDNEKKAKMEQLKAELEAATEKLNVIKNVIDNESTITVDIDGQEFELKRPVITESLYEYEGDKVIRCEVDTNAILVGGGEEKRISTFEYTENGLPSKVITTSSNDKDAISTVEYDDHDRIVRATTPISIIEQTYDDENKTQTVVTKDMLRETQTVELFKFIDGEYRSVSTEIRAVASGVVGTINEDYDIDNDMVTVSVTGFGHPKGVTSVSKYTYKSKDMIECNRTNYGEFKDVYLRNIRDDKGRLSKVQILDAAGNNVIHEFEYELEEMDDNDYIVKNKYESIYVKKDDKLTFIDIIQLNPYNDTKLSSAQNVTYGKYHMETSIIYNDKTEDGVDKIGKYLTITSSDNKFELHYKLLVSDEDEIDAESIQTTFIYNNKQYFIDFGDSATPTNITVANLKENGDIEYQKDITINPLFNLSTINEVKDYFIGVFKKFIETDDILKELFSMSKVSIDLLGELE